MKPKLATASLAGCFGCHMSFLDIDERLLDLVERVDIDKSPLDDKKLFDGPVDIGLIEGGCANEHNVHVLREFRRHCKILISVGACAISGGVPALRNRVSLKECLEESFINGLGIAPGAVIPNDEDLPLLLDKVYPCHEFVHIDYFMPGCPPSGDVIWHVITSLLDGKPLEYPYVLKKFD